MWPLELVHFLQMIYGVEGLIKAIKVIGCVAFKQLMALSVEIKVIKTGWVNGLAKKTTLDLLPFRLLHGLQIATNLSKLRSNSGLSLILSM